MPSITSEGRFELSRHQFLAKEGQRVLEGVTRGLGTHAKSLSHGMLEQSLVLRTPDTAITLTGCNQTQHNMTATTLNVARALASYVSDVGTGRENRGGKL